MQQRFDRLTWYKLSLQFSDEDCYSNCYVRGNGYFSGGSRDDSHNVLRYQLYSALIRNFTIKYSLLFL